MVVPTPVPTPTINVVDFDVRAYNEDYIDPVTGTRTQFIPGASFSITGGPEGPRTGVTGSTLLSFRLTAGEQYSITAADPEGWVFVKWNQNFNVSANRTITLIPNGSVNPIAYNAYYRTTGTVPTPTPTPTPTGSGTIVNINAFIGTTKVAKSFTIRDLTTGVVESGVTSTGGSLDYSVDTMGHSVEVQMDPAGFVQWGVGTESWRYNPIRTQAPVVGTTTLTAHYSA